jgi:hypothetical protein
MIKYDIFLLDKNSNLSNLSKMTVFHNEDILVHDIRSGKSYKTTADYINTNHHEIRNSDGDFFIVNVKRLE